MGACRPSLFVETPPPGASLRFWGGTGLLRARLSGSVPGGTGCAALRIPGASASGSCLQRALTGLGDQAVGAGATDLRFWKKTLSSLLATVRPGTLSACCLTAA